jgi:carbon-monoxide dehydrogenase large subunit
METRAALGRGDAAEERFALFAPLRNPHDIRKEYADRVRGIPGHRLRVISPDMGGAFGPKESPFPELGLVLVAAHGRDARCCGSPIAARRSPETITRATCRRS